MFSDGIKLIHTFHEFVDYRLNLKIVQKCKIYDNPSFVILDLDFSYYQNNILNNIKFILKYN